MTKRDETFAGWKARQAEYAEARLSTVPTSGVFLISPHTKAVFDVCLTAAEGGWSSRRTNRVLRQMHDNIAMTSVPGKFHG